MDNASLKLIFILAVICIKSKTSEHIRTIILAYVLYWYATSNITLWEKHNLQGLKINYSGKYLDLRQREDEQFRILQNSKCPSVLFLQKIQFCQASEIQEAAIISEDKNVHEIFVKTPLERKKINQLCEVTYCQDAVCDERIINVATQTADC